MSTTQHTLLRVFRHMGDLSFELTRRPNIDQGFARLALRQGFFVKRPNLIVCPSRRYRVLGWTRLRYFSSEISLFGHPLVPATIHNPQIPMPEKSEYPEGVASPPVRFVAIKDARGVGSNSNPAGQRSKSLWINVVAHGVVIQIALPVHMDGSWKMPSVIQQHIFIAFNDSNLRVVQVFSNPLRANQGFGVSVFSGGHIAILHKPGALRN